jgi:hypothetical protein
LKYAPKAGGYCAFGISGYDPHGMGLFYSCTTEKDCYQYHDGELFWFLNPEVSNEG